MGNLLQLLLDFLSGSSGREEAADPKTARVRRIVTYAFVVWIVVLLALNFAGVL